MELFANLKSKQIVIVLISLGLLFVFLRPFQSSPSLTDVTVEAACNLQGDIYGTIRLIQERGQSK
jgi:hypothetical protein